MNEAPIVTPLDDAEESLAKRFNMADLIENTMRDLEPYEPLETPYDLRDMERDRAYLRTKSKDLNTRRIAAEKKANEQFVLQIKTPVRKLTDLCDEKASILDGWIKEIEAGQKARKRGRLIEYWTGCGGNLAEAVNFEQIEDPKWLNKTCKLDQAYKDIDAKIEEIAGDLALLKRETHPVETKAEYLRTLDYKQAVKHAQDIAASVERAKRLEEAKQANIAALESKPEPEPVPTDEHSEPVSEYRLRVVCTKTQLEALLSYIRTHGITGGYA